MGPYWKEEPRDPVPDPSSAFFFLKISLDIQKATTLGRDECQWSSPGILVYTCLSFHLYSILISRGQTFINHCCSQKVNTICKENRFPHFAPLKNGVTGHKN